MNKFGGVYRKLFITALLLAGIAQHGQTSLDSEFDSDDRWSDSAEDWGIDAEDFLAGSGDGSGDGSGEWASGESTEEESLDDAPVPPHCGRSKFNAEHALTHGEESESEEDMVKRVVGGVVSQAGEWPWLVSMNLDLRGSDNFDHVCGGSLISPQWILTAAHCFGGKTAKPSLWRMRLGEHGLFEPDDTQISVEVEKIYTHPLRREDSFQDLVEYDAALVKLARPVEYTEHIQPICLPSPGDQFPGGTPCLVAGWGHRVEGGPNVAKHVNHARMPIIDRQECLKMYLGIGWINADTLTSTTICAGVLEGGSGSCQGDSGGGLICYNRKEQRWLIAGIVSYGVGCARPNFPTVYAKVTKFLPWIEETIARDAETSAAAGL